MADPVSRTSGRVRTTRQALAIEAALHDTDGFRTAQELYDEVRGRGHQIGLTTVYRHLNLLADNGSADTVHREDGETQFRLCGPAAEAVDRHHHHLVCRVCGRSVEVSGPEVEEWAGRVAADAGYTEISHTFEVFGLCPQHSAKPKSKQKSMPKSMPKPNRRAPSHPAPRSTAEPSPTPGPRSGSAAEPTPPAKPRQRTQGGGS